MGKIKEKNIEKLNEKKKVMKMSSVIDKEITDKNYYNDHMYTTNSTLKLFIDKCPKSFEYTMQNPPLPSAAMRFGTAFHMVALEGMDTFYKHYAVEPDNIDKRTTIGKTTWERFVARSRGKEHISHKDFTLITNMNAELRSNKNYSLLSECNKFEEICLWRNETLDILCKGKLDAINTQDKYIVDLKTTRDASPDAFRETIINHKYHMQAAFYCDALGYKDYYIYAIEKSKPYCMCVYKISDELIREGRLMYTQAIIEYKAYIHNNTPAADYNDGQIYEI